MNKEKLNEIAKRVCNVCEMGCGFEGECDIGNNYKTCSICQETAEEIYKYFANHCKRCELNHDLL